MIRTSGMNYICITILKNIIVQLLQSSPEIILHVFTEIIKSHLRKVLLGIRVPFVCLNVKTVFPGKTTRMSPGVWCIQEFQKHNLKWKHTKFDSSSLDQYLDIPLGRLAIHSRFHDIPKYTECCFKACFIIFLMYKMRIMDIFWCFKKLDFEAMYSCC